MLKAAELGEKRALNYMGRFSIDGSQIKSGIRKNCKKAVKWFEKAYENGSLRGGYDLGVCYFYGWGVPEDKAKAVELWKSVLEKYKKDPKESIGPYSNIYVVLSRCYYNGWGVEKDEKKAKEILREKYAPNGEIFCENVFRRYVSELLRYEPIYFSFQRQSF